MVVISIVQYLTNKGEYMDHTLQDFLNAYIKPQ